MQKNRNNVCNNKIFFQTWQRSQFAGIFRLRKNQCNATNNQKSNQLHQSIFLISKCYSIEEMGIKFFLIINKQGQSKLSRYYVDLNHSQKEILEANLVRKCIRDIGKPQQVNIN